MRHFRIARWGTAALACTAALCATPASAQYDEYTSWGTPGSAGIVDDADIGKVALNERIVSFKTTTTLPAKAVIRYNMPADALGMWGGGDSYSRSFYVRFLDSGPSASIKIKLKRSNYSSAAITTVWDWSSDTVSSAPSTDYRASWTCVYGTTTDFFPRNTYWLEVEMNKTDATGVLWAWPRSSSSAAIRRRVRSEALAGPGPAAFAPRTHGGKRPG